MSGNALVREQHETFQRLQTVLNTDRSQRAAAQGTRAEKDAEVQNVRNQAQSQLDRKLDQVTSLKGKIDSDIGGSNWNGKVEQGTPDLSLSGEGTSDGMYQCYLAAEEANRQVTAFLAKNPEQSSPAGCWVGFIIAVVAFILIAAASQGQGAVAGLLLGGFTWLGVALMISSSRKVPLQNAYATVVAAVENAQQERNKQLTTIEGAYQAKLEQARRDYEQQIAQLDSTLPEQMTLVTPYFEKFQNTIGILGNNWNSSFWSEWTPASVSAQATRFGSFLSIHPKIPSVPAMIGCPSTENLLFEVAGDAKQQVIQTIQSLMLHMLATQPPSKVRFTLIDPIGLGQNVASFMQLVDHDEKLVGSRAWSETKHIDQQLADLSEHMGNVIQKYLRGQYTTIDAYNEHAGEVAEPYRVLVVTGFPVKFSQEAATRLVEIATNGPRCGVFTLVMFDTEQQLPYDFNLDDLRRVSAVIEWDGKSFAWRDPDFANIPLQLDVPPPLSLLNTILQEVGTLSAIASEVRVPFDRLALPPDKWWQANTNTGISAPLGRRGTKPQLLELGKGTAQHVLIAGKTGAGKTNLLHVLLINLALTYSPNELELFLIDFKTVGFTPYATFQLPHARVVATQSEREFGLSALQGLDQQLEQRKTLFSNAHVQDIAQFRVTQPGVRMPRILLLVDEFQEFFTYEDKVAQGATLLLDRLVRQGRAFGIHVMLGSQTLSGAYTPARTTIGQMAVRIALQCEESDSRLILSDDNPAARLLSRAGEAIYNASNGLIEGNNPFQCAWLPEEELERYLGRIYTYMQRSRITLPWQQIIFQGDANADVKKNVMLNQTLAAPYAPQPARVVPVWIGDPISIKDALTVQFKQQAGNNLLMIGQQDEAALGIQMTMLFSLAASYAKQQMRCYIFDFTPLDYPLAGRLASLQQALPHNIKMVTRRTLSTAIEEISAEVKLRMDTNSPDSEAIYLCIYGLQRIRDLRPDEDMGFSSFSDSTLPPSISKQFATILREGPELGIHTVAWCDTYANVTRTLERGTLREFEVRVLFQMSVDDSTNLIDVPDASKIGLHRALLYNDETGRLEKFIPYGIPSDKWLQDAATVIQQKNLPIIKQ